MLGSPVGKLKITMINTLRAWMEKLDNMLKQVGKNQWKRSARSKNHTNKNEECLPRAPRQMWRSLGKNLNVEIRQ